MAEDSDQATPLRDAPVAALEDLLRAVPLLIERTVRQAGLVRSAATHLPCLGSFSRRLEPSEAGTVTPEQLGVLDLFADGRIDSPSDDPAVGTVPVHDQGAAATNGSVPLESELAVPDYDSLAASQVVPRLAMMSVADLRAVLAYEQGHRHRQTILNRVSQLLGA